MQIILVQSEIEQALKDYVGARLVIAEGNEVTVELRATRGADGSTAIIDILPSGKKVIPVVAIPEPEPVTKEVDDEEEDLPSPRKLFSNLKLGNSE